MTADLRRHDIIPRICERGNGEELRGLTGRRRYGSCPPFERSNTVLKDVLSPKKWTRERAFDKGLNVYTHDGGVSDAGVDVTKRSVRTQVSLRTRPMVSTYFNPKRSAPC